MTNDQGHLEDEMNRQQISLLVEISGGRSGFQPEGDSDADVASFGRTVRDLQEIESMGYIEIVDQRKESRSGQRNDSLVLVRITLEGQQWLSSHRSQKTTESL